MMKFRNIALGSVFAVASFVASANDVTVLCPSCNPRNASDALTQSTALAYANSHLNNLSPGDTIDIEVTGVGRLSNTVVETPAPRASEGFPPSPDSEGVRKVALGNEERLPDKFKTK